MTCKELIKVMGLKSGGNLSKQLNTLEESGFISAYTDHDDHLWASKK